MSKEKINIVYEDNDLMVIDKPTGLVVESDKKSDFTLEKILVDEYKINLPRGGIVHRLDRDTSGLMVVAKNEKALVNLQNQFASHQVKKTYIALVYGKLEQRKGAINIALKRDPKNRTRFVAFRAKNAREAITHYEAIPRSDLGGYPKIGSWDHWNHDLKTKTTFLKISLLTGRTHQIRAHFFAIGYPIVGDQVYKSRDSEIFSKKIGLKRQFLHALELSFKHPATGKKIDFKSDLPEDLKSLIVAN